MANSRIARHVAILKLPTLPPEGPLGLRTPGTREDREGEGIDRGGTKIGIDGDDRRYHRGDDSLERDRDRRRDDRRRSERDRDRDRARGGRDRRRRDDSR